MRWKPISDRLGSWRGARESRLNDWHTWFAWHPVRIGDKAHWLELVQRRREVAGQARGIRVYNVFTGSLVYAWKYKA